MFFLILDKHKGDFRMIYRLVCRSYMALPVPNLPVPVPNLVFLAMYDGFGAVLVQVIVIFQVSISNRSRRF